MGSPVQHTSSDIVEALTNCTLAGADGFSVKSKTNNQQYCQPHHCMYAVDKSVVLKS